jgi:hypothetical protein
MSCNRCGTLASGHPIASALSDARGRFRIANVAVGKDVPLVMQVGKWRRQVMVPEVRACEDNRLTDAQATRLPRNRKEGDLPRVAVTTGICDPLSCTVAKLGVDPAELGVSGQDTLAAAFHIHGPNVRRPDGSPIMIDTTFPKAARPRRARGGRPGLACTADEGAPHTNARHRPNLLHCCLGAVRGSPTGACALTLMG